MNADKLTCGRCGNNAFEVNSLGRNKDTDRFDIIITCSDCGLRKWVAQPAKKDA